MGRKTWNFRKIEWKIGRKERQRFKRSGKQEGKKDKDLKGMEHRKVRKIKI